MTEVQVWADFDAALGIDKVTLDLGPEWKTRGELADYYHLSTFTLGRVLREQIEAGKVETCRGLDRKSGKPATFYRVVK